jgi:hypothetical protein
MEIAIALDTYDDIFSDFDIRGYGERALSRDFLDELRVRIKKAGTRSDLSIVLLIPRRRRKPGDEELITRRTRAFFAERGGHYAREDAKSKWRSALFVAIGLFLSLAANFFAERLAYLPLFKDFLLIPAWFFVWSGLELFVRNRDEIVGKKEYYHALHGSRVEFRDIEDYRRTEGARESLARSFPRIGRKPPS